MTLEARVFRQLDDLAPLTGTRPVVTVSGGGDSVALMHLMARWSRDRAVSLHTVTVDHCLRSGSAEDALVVKVAAEALGLPHETLRWTGWDGTGNLQDSARWARRSLVETWAAERGITAALTGHTADDQTETVLMRLARGSGVDGLAGIDMNRVHGIRWLRPLLGVWRAELRGYLRSIDVSWIEDPSNDDDRFDRVRARNMLGTLSDLGLSPERLQETARHMRSAKAVLDSAMVQLAERAIVQDGGDLVIDRATFRAAAQETRCRLLARALMWVSGSDYRPRFGPLSDLAESGGGTLQGCHVIGDDSVIRIVREYQAVRNLSCGTEEVWDKRWRLEGPHSKGLAVHALGPGGLSQLPDWRSVRRPRTALLATPGVWHGDLLVAAPCAGRRDGWSARLVPDRADFVDSLMPH